MKIYVDELPKSCWECPCFRNDIECNCGLDDGTNDYFLDEIDGGECPLQSIANHDKQVRKEVCAKIRANAISHNNLEVDMYYITPQQLYEIEQGETK